MLLQSVPWHARNRLELVVGALIAAAGLVWTVAFLLWHSARIRAFRRFADSHGFNYTAFASRTVRGDLQALTGQDEVRVSHLITGESCGRSFAIYETLRKEFDGGSWSVFPSLFPRARQRHRHALVTSAPAWPDLTIQPESAYTSFAKSYWREEVALGDPGFDQVFYVVCEDEKFARLLLTEPMKEYMLRMRPLGAWRIGAGRLSVRRRGLLRPDAVGPLLRKLEEFWALVPPQIATQR